MAQPEQPQRQIQRERVRHLARCPKCGAARGQYCLGVRGRRKANHLERVVAALNRRSAQSRAGAGSTET
jgi:hypothetical protein